MSTTASDDEQCRALTRDGERCSRPAQGDGFCHQHDQSDETVDEAEEADGGDADGAAEVGSDDPAEDAADDSAGDDGDEGGDESTDGTAEQESDMSSGETQQTNIGDVREVVLDTAEGVVGHPLDGIVSIDNTDGGWRVAVEVVERKSVPDTQDILGRYEIELDDDLSVTGYQRTHRYRRDDMNHDI